MTVIKSVFLKTNKQFFFLFFYVVKRFIYVAFIGVSVIYVPSNIYRGYPCFGLAAIFAGMLYNVQIIQKSSTRNIMHVNIIVLKLPAKLHEVID